MKAVTSIVVVCAVVATLLAAPAAATPYALESESSAADGVTAFQITPPGGVNQLSGRAVMNGDTVYYGGSEVVYQVKTNADRTSASVVQTYSVPTSSSFYQQLGPGATPLTMVNGSAWFATRNGGLGAAGLCAFNPSSGQLPAESFPINNARMHFAFFTEPSNEAYIILDNAVYMRTGPSKLKQLFTLPMVFTGYNAQQWGQYAIAAYDYNDGHVYLTGMSGKPGAPMSDAPWYTITQVNIYTQQNRTIYVNQVVHGTPTVPASMFFDDTYMYLVQVATDNTNTDDDVNFQQPGNTVQIRRWPLATAFDTTTPTSKKFPPIPCQVEFPQPSSPMVDRFNSYVYLVCGISQPTRVSLKDSNLGATQIMCDDVVASGKPAQHYWPRQVPKDQIIPTSFTNYGDVGLDDVKNWVGFLDLTQVSWSNGSCPPPWYLRWWVWVLFGILFIILWFSICWYGKRRCKKKKAPLASATPVAAIPIKVGDGTSTDAKYQALPPSDKSKV